MKKRLRNYYDRFVRSKYVIVSVLLNAYLFLGFVNTSFASGNQNITISNSTTSSTGTWTVTGAFVPYSYTFQPNAASDVASLNAADIVSCLTGSGATLGGSAGAPGTAGKAGHVTILTASTGAGVGTGNVTISQPISTTLSVSTQLTFTITAAGSINVSNTISVTGNSGGVIAIAAGFPGANVTLNSGTGISMTGGSGIVTDGGAGASLGGAGAAAGAITMTAATGNVNQSIACSAVGGGGGGFGGAGGAGGNVILTATVGAATLNNSFTNTGGSGVLSGLGGKGGDVTISGNTGASLNAIWNGYGGNGGATSGNGGAGGTLTMSAPGGTAVVGNSVNNYGGNSNNATGGNGGNVSLTAFTSNITVACNSYGGNGGGSGSGGNGGALTMLAPAGTITLSNTFNSSGGTGGTTGAGGNGGTWNLTALSTVTVSVACSSNGGNGGSFGGNGGSAGAMTFISTASNVSMSNTLNSIGGRANGGNSSGGTGGNIIIYSATNFNSSSGNDIYTTGGNATGSGPSGSGGNITLTGNAAHGGLSLVRTYTTSAGTGGSGTAGIAGTLTVSTGNSVTTTGGGVNDGQPTSTPTLIVGAAPLTKTGTGVFFLGATNNSYTGLTTVSTGTLKIGADKALGTNANGTTVSNGATIDINNINYATTEPLTLTGSGVSGVGAMTTSTGTAGTWTGVVTVAGGTSIGAAAGATLAISGQIVGSGGITKVDYGTLSLLATSNSFGGSTTISAGTLQIAASEVIPNGSGIVLNGGTLRTNGAFSETMGTLTVNAGSFVTFGSASAHTLTFANSNAISWAAGGTITISGWTGTYGAGTTGTTKFIVGTSGNVLINTQLGKIQFIDAAGAYWTAQLVPGTAEVVPGTGNTFYAIANGNWNTNTTWSFTPGGPAVPAGIFPTALKNVVISSSYTVTLTAAAACNNITFGSAASGLTMAANNLTLYGNMNIVTTCPAISTTGGNIIFDGTNNSSQTLTSTCAGATLGNVTLTNNANILSSGGAFSITNLTSASGTSSWINNATTGSNGMVTVTGVLAAPACNFISNTAPTTAAFNFSGASNSPITVGGLISNSTGTINLGAKNTTISNLLSYTSGTITSTGIISMAANSVITAKAALTIANLQLGGSGVTSTGGGTLTATIFDFNAQTSFTQTAGVITTPVINNNTGPMSMAYSGTPTFIYSGSGIIPSGSYYNLTTTTNTKSVTCSSTITVDGVLTNSSGTITGPATSGQFGRFINANPVNNIGGTIGSASTNLSFSGTIQGGTVIGNGTNVLQNSSQNASCTFFIVGVTSISGYSYCQGAGPSVSKSFTLSGSGLTGSGNVLVTGSADYEVSSDNITFGPSASYPFAAGIITGQPKIVYVRTKAGLLTGTYNSETVTVNAAGGATAKTVSNNGSVISGCGRTWTGNTSTDWHTNTNWNPTVVPTLIDDVIIPNVTNKPVIASSATGEAKAIAINANSSLTINSTGTLNAYGSIVNNGTFTASTGSTVALLGNTAQTITGISVLYNTTVNNTVGVTIASGAASAITVKGKLLLTSGALTTNSNLTVDIDNGGNIGYTSGDGGTVSGNVTVFRAINSKTTHYISCPLNGVTANDLADDAQVINPATNKTRLFQYDNTTLSWTGVSDLNTVMAPSTPFSMWFPAITSVDFTGTYNHAASYTYTGTNTANKFMFIPNPYPGALDWEATGWTKTGIKNAVYFWNPATNSYASYVSGQGSNSATQFIPAMNSFFVAYDGNAGTPTATVGMTNSIRASTYQAMWRTAADETVRITLKSSSGSADETVIRFNEDATNEFDNDLDAYKFMNASSVPSIYTKIGTTNYSINSLSSPDATDTIQVLTKVPADGDYVLQIKSSDPAIEYVLLDKKMGTEKVIGTGDYAFTALKTDSINRFDLLMRQVEVVTTGTQSSSILSGLNILSSPNGFLVKSNVTGAATIEILDVRGNRVNVLTDVSLVKGNNFFNPALADGFYVVKVIIGDTNYIGQVSIIK